MIHTYKTGNPLHPAIVFLHGGGLSSKSWYPVIEQLPDFYCLAPDLPGHGLNREISFSLDDSAQKVIEVIRSLVPGQKAHLVGWSLGGAVLLRLLHLAPEVVDHVILTGSSGRLPRWLVEMSLPLFTFLRFMKPETLVQSTLRQHGIPAQYRDLLHDDILISNNIEFMRQVYAELTKFEMPQNVSNPLLVCVGETEPGAAKLYGAMSLIPLRRYASARGVAMPKGKHAWPLQFPDVFAEMVRAWVTDRPLPAVLRPLQN